MRRFSFLLFLICSGWFCFGNPQLIFSANTQEQVTSFTADYTLNQDGTISVIEDIEYFVPSEKHGIYRYLPLSYGNRPDNKVNWKNVANAQTGSNIPYTVSQTNGNTIAKIGDPDQTFSGARTFRLIYDVSRPTFPLENYDELYWDAVGEGWDFPVQKTSVILHSPYADFQAVRCYAGAFGGNDGLCQVEIIAPDQARITYDHPIRRGENLTFVAELARPNQFQIIAALQKEKQIKMLLTASAILGILVLVVAFYFFWRNSLADQIFIGDVSGLNPTGSVRPKPLFYQPQPQIWYEPFPNLTAAQAGFLLNKKANTACLVAIILDLAQKQLLIITAIPSGKKLSLKKTDYLLVKNSSLAITAGQLDSASRLIYHQLFAKKDQIKISAINADFYEGVVSWPKKLKSDLQKQNYLLPNPFNLTRLSALGSYYQSLCLGLKEVIRLGKWQEEIKEKELYIDKILPYAVAFGVVNQLTRDMAKLNLPPPSYFRADDQLLAVNQAFLLSSFAQDFNKSFAQSYHSAMQSSIQASLSETSSGSSSSGGGGYSGGGGGGGGGGSW